MGTTLCPQCDSDNPDCDMCSGSGKCPDCSDTDCPSENCGEVEREGHKNLAVARHSLHKQEGPASQ
jgi:hypothetical protein